MLTEFWRPTDPGHRVICLGSIRRNALKRLMFLLLCPAILAGCAASHYQFTTGRAAIDNPLSPPVEQQIIQGKPHKFLDASDWIWPGSLLAKLLLWNKKVDSHEISEKTLCYLHNYLQLNDMQNVQVLANVYKPGNQWRRLFKNRTVGAGWRYTLGILSVSWYTIMPGRFFGGDAYNPYTNTIYLYSDIPAVALHEGGHAKDFGRRKYKGSHAFIYAIPFAALYYEAIASNDALSYLRHMEMYQEQKEAYKILHPAYGTYVFGNLSAFWGPAGLAALGVIPGHITGAIAAGLVKEEHAETHKRAFKFKEEPPQKLRDCAAITE